MRCLYAYIYNSRVLGGASHNFCLVLDRFVYKHKVENTATPRMIGMGPYAFCFYFVRLLKYIMVVQVLLFHLVHKGMEILVG